MVQEDDFEPELKKPTEVMKGSSPTLKTDQEYEEDRLDQDDAPMSANTKWLRQIQLNRDDRIQFKTVACRGGGGRGGGHGPRAQALEGAPAQLVGANFKKKIMPRQIRKVTSL